MASLDWLGPGATRVLMSRDIGFLYGNGPTTPSRVTDLASVPDLLIIETPAKTTGVSVPTAFRDAGKCIISVRR